MTHSSTESFLEKQRKDEIVDLPWRESIAVPWPDSRDVAIFSMFIKFYE